MVTLSFWGVIIIVLTLLGFILYSYIKYPTRTKVWFDDFKHGFEASGMPVWWTRYNNSYFGFFIRWSGSLSIVVRNTFPSLTDSYPWFSMLMVVSGLLLFVHLFIRGICCLWSRSKYAWLGKYKKYNSPFSLQGTFRRIAGLAGKRTVGGVATTAGRTAGTVVAISQAQKEVFEASEDQLLTTKLRNIVRLAKYQTGYTKPVSVDISIPVGPPTDLKDTAVHDHFGPRPVAKVSDIQYKQAGKYSKNK